MAELGEVLKFGSYAMWGHANKLCYNTFRNSISIYLLTFTEKSAILLCL